MLEGLDIIHVWNTGSIADDVGDRQDDIVCGVGDTEGHTEVDNAEAGLREEDVSTMEVGVLDRVGEHAETVEQTELV